MIISHLAAFLFRWIGWPGIVGLCVYFFFVGVPFLNWWPINSIPAVGVVVEGDISRRIEAHDRAKHLKDLANARKAEQELGEREAARAERNRIRDARSAQQRVDLARSQAEERERFLSDQNAERLQRIEALQNALATSENQKTKVITRYVKKCGYPGDAKPTDSFLQQYRKLLSPSD